MSKEEIFENAFERAKIKYPNENWKSWDEIGIEKELVYEAMTEYAHQALDEAAKEATLSADKAYADIVSDEMSLYAFKSYNVGDSILKLKEKY